MHHTVRARDRLARGRAVAQVRDERLLAFVLRCHGYAVDEAERPDVLGDRRAQSWSRSGQPRR